MTKTNLLVCAVLLGLLSTSFAVPYGNPRLVDELKIPYCLDQLGYQCRACGYNTDAKTFTAPNLLWTACLPSQNGCTGYADMKGEVCIKDKVCQCGFNLDFWGKCIPKVIDNCQKLDVTGTECVQCIDSASGIFGGGLNDYGQSFDNKQCIDNVANATPNCQQYTTGDLVCGQCQTGYYLNSLNKCIKPSVGGFPSSCEVISDNGERCLRCKYYQQLVRAGATDSAITDTCSTVNDNTGSPDANCLDWTWAPNGVDYNLNNCVLCAPGYFLIWDTSKLSPRCTSIIDANGIPKTFSLDDAGTTQDSNAKLALYEWCIAYTDIPTGGGDTVRICSIPRIKANIDLYTVAKTSTKIVSDANKCNDWDASTATCKTQNDCQASTTYDQTWKICSSNYWSCLNNCKVSDGGAFCETCHEGYVAENGRCRMISSSAGCQEENVDGTCKTCFFNTVGSGSVVKSYKLNDNGDGSCVEVVIANCAAFGDNNLCTTCATGYTLQKNMCKPNAATSAQAMPYGCLEGDKTKCTKPLPGFYCGTDGAKCVQATCATYDANGECLTCRWYQQTRVWNQSTNKYECTVVADFWGGSQFNTNQECKESMDGCTCSVCQDGLPAISDGKCNRWADTPSGYKSAIDGCLKHSSDTACDVCEEGSIKTTDNKCYTNYKRSRSLYYYSGDSGYDQVPELCKTASTATACTECDTTYDVGLISIAANKGAASVPATAFCVFNKQLAQKRTNGNNVLSNSLASGYGVANDANVNLDIPGCKTYQADTIPGTLCTAALTGWSLTGTEATTLDNSSLADGTPAIASGNRCKLGKVAAGKCTDCNDGYYLQNDICNLNSSGCLQMDATTAKCTTPLPGWALDSTTDTPNVVLYNSWQTATSGCTDNLAFNCAIRKWKYVQPAVGGTYWEVSECGKGTELKNTRCVASATIIPNCANFSPESGNCQKCSAGFQLIFGHNSNNARQAIGTTKCVQSITNCLTYSLTTGKCTSCNNNDGINRVLDDVGNVCVNPKDAISGCQVYAWNDPTKCIKCVLGRGLPEDGCKNKDTNCWQSNAVTGNCETCAVGFVSNYKGVCIPNQALPNCDVAYNATQCFKCSGSNVKLRNKDNAESEYIGTCVSSHVPNCQFANEANTECLRCKENYAPMGGYCLSVDTSIFPSECAQHQYDVDKKKLYCSECNRGYAIDKNYTTCVNNNHLCADISGGNDCNKLESLVGYETKAKCADYGRSSSTLIVFSALIASIIFLLF